VGRDDGTTASVYVQCGQQTIADYTSGTAASSPTYTYVYGSYIDEPVMRVGGSGNTYYHRTNQYSVTALTNALGTIVERYAYDAYGTPTITDASGTVRSTTAEGNRYTYTGREYDGELGLYHYRARMYDSLSGRFLSRDPIGYEGSQYNLQQYVGSSPLRWLDPLGLKKSDEAGIDISIGAAGYLGPGGGFAGGYSIYKQSCCEDGKRSNKWVQEVSLHGEIGFGLGGHVTFAGWHLGEFQWTAFTENLDAKSTCESPCGSTALGCCKACVSWTYSLPLGPGRSLSIGGFGLAVEMVTAFDVSLNICYHSDECEKPGLHGSLCFKWQVTATFRMGWTYYRSGLQDDGCLTYPGDFQ
ncbi:RHS repeat-associated core domain-containing protein, partial [Roseiconus lacunae]|uniref:RHS repeat-associated core domain-containing protein n=1 Tax=Roseiconus lacunae TaxID=2605694 RepID=UPI001E394955